jgi:hypothetical protein
MDIKSPTPLKIIKEVIDPCLPWKNKEKDLFRFYDYTNTSLFQSWNFERDFTRGTDQIQQKWRSIKEKEITIIY